MDIKIFSHLYRKPIKIELVKQNPVSLSKFDIKIFYVHVICIYDAYSFYQETFILCLCLILTTKIYVNI